MSDIYLAINLTGEWGERENSLLWTWM